MSRRSVPVILNAINNEVLNLMCHPAIDRFTTTNAINKL